MSDEDRRTADIEWRATTTEILKNQNKSLERIEGHLEKQNGRIGSLENSRSLVVGGGTVLGAISGWLTAHFGGGK